MLESSSVSSVASRVWDVVLRTVGWGACGTGHQSGITLYNVDTFSPGLPRQCCPQGGGEPASRLSQPRLQLEGNPKGL